MTRDKDRTRYRISRTKLRRGTLLGAGLTAIGLVILVFGGASIADAGPIGAVNLFIAAGVLISVLRSARDRRPRMVLDRRGIWDRDWGLEVKVPWPQGAEASIAGSRLQSLVRAKPRDPAGFLVGLSDERARLKSNRLARLPELRLPNDAPEVPLDGLLAEIPAMLSASGPPQQIRDDLLRCVARPAGRHATGAMTRGGQYSKPSRPAQDQGFRNPGVFV